MTNNGYLNYKYLLECINKEDINASAKPEDIKEIEPRIEFKIQPSDIISDDTSVGNGHFGDVKAGIYCGNKVAIKTQKPSSNSLHLSIYYNEILMLQCLNHRNIVKFIGASKEKECIVTEFIEGQTLRNYLNINGTKLDQKLRIKFATQIADAMCHAHTMYIIHCDLTSDNIMVDQDLNIKIIDFGISKHVSGIDNIEMVCGNYLYMDPKVFKDGRIAYSVDSDLFSFSLVLYELMTSSKPIPSEYKDKVKDWARMVSGGTRLSLECIKNVEIVTMIQKCWSGETSFDNIKEQLKELYFNLYGEKI